MVVLDKLQSLQHRVPNDVDSGTDNTTRMERRNERVQEQDAAGLRRWPP